MEGAGRRCPRLPPSRSSFAGRTALPRCAGQRSFCFHAEARRIRALPRLTIDLALAQVGVALVSSEEAHRVFILDILGTICGVDHLALRTNSVTGTNVLDNLLKLACHRVPITPDFNSNLVVRHRTSSRLWPAHNVHSFLAVRSIRYAALFALREACALILSDVWTTDSDPMETFCPRSPQAWLSCRSGRQVLEYCSLARA